VTVQVVRVGQKRVAAVVRVDSHQSGVQVVPILSGSGAGSGERWWQGEGPPPDLIVGSRPGDWYWDTISGNVFELTEGV
jgi:hypothetical protein